MYVDSDAHEQRLRSLHRRVYLDVPPTGHEGVWFVRDHEENMNSLEALAWERSSKAPPAFTPFFKHLLFHGSRYDVRKELVSCASS